MSIFKCSKCGIDDENNIILKIHNLNCEIRTIQKIDEKFTETDFWMNTQDTDFYLSCSSCGNEWGIEDIETKDRDDLDDFLDKVQEEVF